MPLRLSLRFWHTSAPMALLVLLVLSLSVVQYRWLGELGDSARDRLDRDLRVATQSAAGAVEEAVRSKQSRGDHQNSTIEHCEPRSF